MDVSLEDEKKPFDTEMTQEDDSMPDPDEIMQLDRGNGRLWLVKVSSNPLPCPLSFRFYRKSKLG
jgi:transcription initiation factor TFIIF subunit beta